MSNAPLGFFGLGLGVFILGLITYPNDDKKFNRAALTSIIFLLASIAAKNLVL